MTAGNSAAYLVGNWGRQMVDLLAELTAVMRVGCWEMNLVDSTVELTAAS